MVLINVLKIVDCDRCDERQNVGRVAHNKMWTNLKYEQIWILNRKYSIGEKGLNGILLLIIISYLTNFFSPHSLSHNLFIISIGLLNFFYYLFQDFRDNLKKLKIVFIVFLILFIGLLMYKNHDDFYYYHFSYTLSLIEYKKILGLDIDWLTLIQKTIGIIFLQIFFWKSCIL